VRSTNVYIIFGRERESNYIFPLRNRPIILLYNKFYKVYGKCVQDGRIYTSKSSKFHLLWRASLPRPPKGRCLGSIWDLQIPCLFGCSHQMYPSYAHGGSYVNNIVRNLGHFSEKQIYTITWIIRCACGWVGACVRVWTDQLDSIYCMLTNSVTHERVIRAMIKRGKNLCTKQESKTI
jgi:hypothetical protein